MRPNLSRRPTNSSKGPGSTLTIVQNIYHQQEGMQPIHVESRISRKLSSDEQPYVRQLKVGEIWTPLETGWLGECSILVIKNNEGRFTDKLPTPEQVEEAESKVLEIGFSTRGPSPLNPKSIEPEVIIGALEILPRESHPIHPIALWSVYIRSRKGETRYSVTIIPR